MLNLADIYTDYLIAQNKHATATGLADLMPDELSHDQITRLLNKTPQTSKDLWLTRIGSHSSRLSDVPANTRHFTAY
ncbi:hypothetical protein PsalBI1_04127 (plasmid) [Piscirickettsia salmonis]|nr:hypothetical protein [Piscirickettsia salmonis]QGP61485.1 hypothetical protein PsalBI1_04127 [Piscirickettsia salmonis]